MSIKDQVMNDMKAAMLAKDEQRLSALRMIKAEILKAEKEKGLAITGEREMAILQTMVKQRRESIEQFEKAGRAELAAIEQAELRVISAYLPEALGEEEVKAIVESVLGGLGEPDPKQMGKVIGEVMGKLKATGRPFDAKAVNGLVRSRLGAA